MKERKPDGGLAEWIETLEAMGGEDDGEMLCLLLELRRFREDKPELIEQLEALKAKTSMTMGVGMGDGNLFVHGDYESIKAVQSIVFRMEAAEAQVKELTADLDKESEIRHRIHEELNAIKGEQQPIGYIDSASLREYRGVKAGGSWSALPKTGEYNQTTPIYTHPAPALLPPLVDSEKICHIEGLEWIKNLDADECQSCAEVYNQAIADAKALGAKPMPVVDLTALDALVGDFWNSSLLSVGSWRMAYIGCSRALEQCIKEIRAAGLEVK